MNGKEAGAVLTLISGFDRYVVVDKVTIYAWHKVIGQLDVAEAEAAVVEHYSGAAGDQSLTAAKLLDLVRRGRRETPAQIAADVRAARGRRIVPYDWPETTKLPPHHAAELAAARTADRSAASSDAPTGDALGVVDYGVRLKGPDDA